MGRGRRSRVAVGLAVVAVLLAAIGAQATPRRAGGSEVQRANTSALLRLGKEKGYRLILYMPNPQVVLLFGFRFEREKVGSIGLQYHAYAVRNSGDLEHGVVRARFGSLGWVSLRFRPNGRVRWREPRGGCEGGRELVEYGRFAGRLRFRGENDYFHVSAPKGPAAIAHSPRLRCGKGQAQDFDQGPLRNYVATLPMAPARHSIALLYASARGHGRYVGVTAMHMEGAPPGANVQVRVLEARKGMAIGHGAYLEGGEGTLLTGLPGVHPATATLAPPTPFHGEAAYSEETGAWTGDLGVELAGVKLPLAGPGFHVRLCVANPFKDDDGCALSKTVSPPGERPAARPLWVPR